MFSHALSFILTFHGAIDAAASERSAESLDIFSIPHDRIETLKGEATWDDGGFAYRETHSILFAKDKRVAVQTLYSDAAGETFARFISDYRPHPYIPAYHFTDDRFERIEGVAWVDRDTLRVYGRPTGDKELKEKRLKRPEAGFAGQGVYFFMIDQLDTFLASDKPVRLDFVIPIKRKAYDFRIRPLEPKKPNTALLRAEINNWFIRMFAPHMDVTLDTEQRALYKYEGPSNILDEKEKVRSVVIRYAPTVRNTAEFKDPKTASDEPSGIE